MTFEERLQRAAHRVEARLTERLAGGAEASGTSQTPPDRLAAAMRHAVLGGGKRFRPFLVLESAALCGGSEPLALDVAAALECVHCYSLVHDDLPVMDNDRLRRGQPTVWVAYDEWTAVLAGDALLTLAFEVLACAPSAGDADVRLALTASLASAAGWRGMAGGQVIDLEADKLGEPAAPSLAHIRRLQAMKTGALITYACEAGAILARAPGHHRAALRRYGDALGFAFQIADDLLDAAGDAATVGKATGKDAVAGKATLVSLLGIAEARALLARVEAEACAALDIFGPAADGLRAAAAYVSQRRS